MTDQHRYHKACELLDEATRTGASPSRKARLKAWREHLRAAAYASAQTPFTIADLFTTYSHN